jgi:hypothetical protein
MKQRKRRSSLTEISLRFYFFLVLSALEKGPFYMGRKNLEYRAAGFVGVVLWSMIVGCLYLFMPKVVSIGRNGLILSLIVTCGSTITFYSNKRRLMEVRELFSQKKIRKTDAIFYVTITLLSFVAIMKILL